MDVRFRTVQKTVCSWLVLLAVLNKGVYGQDCFFRHDLCGWSNKGDIDWVQKSASTNTGTEHCAEVPLTDSTPAGEHQAVLTSTMQPHVMSVLGFFYRLEAPNTLTVVAELDASGTLTLIWSRNGTEGGASWIEVDVAVPESNHFKISFEAGIPENSTSFVGLTNITLRFGDDECASTPCLNGGYCIDGNNSFTCVCSSGFKGEMCQIDTNAPPKTTTLPPTTKVSTVPPTRPRPSPKATAPQKTTHGKTPPSTDSTVVYGPVSTPAKLPQTGDRNGMDEPVTIAVIAVASVVVIAAFVTAVWALLYCKKRSWRPRYHERGPGMSMENVSNTESIHGKWTSTIDIPGSMPESTPDCKVGLAPVEESNFPKKVENIYVASPTIGILNTGYNIDQMY